MSAQNKVAQTELPAGSPQPGEPVFLVVGRLRRPHGLRGEMVFEVYTDFPERLEPGVTVYLGESHQPARIRTRRASNKALLLGFDHYKDSETVGELRNQLVYVRADDRPPLPAGEYYHHEVLGLRVVSDEGQELGKVTHILDTGANDVYVVRSDNGREVLLPALVSVVLDIDLQAGRILVHLLPGLLPE
jgi:16S rRNA processing protein RimM